MRNVLILYVCVYDTFFVCKISCMCLQTKIILFSACRFGFTTNLILLRVLVRLPAGGVNVAKKGVSLADP